MWGSKLEKKDFGLLYPYFHGNEEDRNFANGIKKMKKLVDAGYVPAICQLAIAYYDHLGVRRNYKESFRYHMIAAKEGYPCSEGWVGNFYATAFPKHDACEYSEKKALEWWLKASEHGVAGAQVNLAGHLLKGAGAEKNPIEAYIWGSLAVHCSPIRFRSAEVYRDQAVSQLSKNEKELADKKITQLKKTLPHEWSDHLDYWRMLYAQAIAAD